MDEAFFYLITDGNETVLVLCHIKSSSIPIIKEWEEWEEWEEWGHGEMGRCLLRVIIRTSYQFSFERFSLGGTVNA
ncbi:hypothetical protein [Moorena sp. SIO3H5]|uniref:hypothetical protein n=1 Tax=Moorena sp. SIO3H5 TaxID=2607834 RepID=UPI0013B98173|nr:hypothetical protein [Moorena sp. SIO3H5]NEO69163.1 hypothetical protein [Moorena sp. SIO3H5]